MVYIPKNKTQINLSTSGGEYVLLSDKTDYIGYYHALYNGKYFTGRTPNSSEIQEIILVSKTNSQNSNSSSPLISIPSSPLFPTSQDYKNGEFIRYFIVRKNQPFFIELDKATFDKYKQRNSTVSWRLYKPFSLFWVLTGDINQVAQTNKNVTELIEQREQVFGLSLFLKENWTQYYKANP
jgi:hypothetical protein